ncbi:MAG: NAD(P)H-dependent oxidoreductase [Treponema sp.]|jgi:NAD(P)H dehydrogenase (quinone)|nr:NAD(P)H-dependent oxidoreductase [Treponema sp.]
MRVFIVYAHPSADSFTREAKDSFIKGLESAGHSYVISDLYGMNFITDMSEAEYLREAYYRRDESVPADVVMEQEKINLCDAIVFIFPLFWSDAPAKMVGWFNRVWTYGFAYGEDRAMKHLEKGLVICCAGNTMEYFQKTGILSAIEKVMLEDRLYDRVKNRELLILDGTSRESPLRQQNRKKHLERAFSAGVSF